MLKHLQGQVTILTTVITATGMIIASALTSWATSSRRISETERQVSVIEERENNHYSEVQKRLETIDRKLDTLLNLGKK